MNRTHYLKTRLTAEEHARLKSRAAREGMKISEYVRAALAAMKPLRRELPPPAGPDAALGPVRPYGFERK